MTNVLVRSPLSEAESLANDLVEHRLAASINRITCTSAYRWEDDVEYVQDRHPYEVAGIERIEETAATPEFVQWRNECVGPKEE